MDPLTAILNIGSTVLDKIFPDKEAADKAKLELLKLQQAGNLTELESEVKLLLAQSATNQEQAKSTSLMVSGGRPAAMWVCVFGLFYTFILQPLLAWVSLLFHASVPPVIDTAMLMQLLFGMLGLAGIRSWEKGKGVASQ